MNGPLRTVLIVDNDPAVLAALRIRIEGAGYRCFAASSGAQGLRMFTAGGVDLVITDLRMPAGDGVSLARKIRASSDTPIIVITGCREDFKRELRSVPDMTLLDKPFEAAELLRLIDAELRRRAPACAE